MVTPGGIGYELFIPVGVYERLPAVGQTVELRTLQVVREDALLLFGFLTEVERTVFSRLLGASGVGPRLALALISALGAEALVRAVRERSIPALTGVSGVGKKTAERLVLDLSGKLDDIPTGGAAGGARTPLVEEAVRALTVLGFTSADAERAVREVAEGGETSSQELIRAALATLR